MEVCGGHTHSIYKYGVDDLLPANVELVHGPGLPGLRDPDGPRRRRHRAGPAARRDLHLLRRHDARARQRRHAARREGRAAPTSGWSTRRSTRCGSRKQNPDREVIFFAIGFETTAPSTALTLKRAKRRGRHELLVLLQPRDDRAAAARAARVARPAARRLHRPGPRRRPSSARARSSSSPPTTASRSSSRASSRSTSCSRSR